MTNYIRTRYEPGLGETEMEAHINEVYRDLSTLFTPDMTEEYPAGGETFETAFETAVYTMPVATRTIKQVHIRDASNDRIRLRSMMPESLLYPRETGFPLRWYAYGYTEGTASGVFQKFGLDPIPAAPGSPLIVLYEPIPGELYSNDDVPEYVPAELHYLICWGTIAILAGRNEDYNNAQYWESKYRAAFNERMLFMGQNIHLNHPEVSRRITQMQQQPTGQGE